MWTPGYRVRIAKSLLNEGLAHAIDRIFQPPLLGFDDIERIRGEESQPYRLRSTLAVAGFDQNDLDITVEENELTIAGEQSDDVADSGAGPGKDYLYRGIAARQFKRTFVLADGMHVTGADLRDGLLSIELARPEPDKVARKIVINADG